MINLRKFYLKTTTFSLFPFMFTYDQFFYLCNIRKINVVAVRHGLELGRSNPAPNSLHLVYVYIKRFFSNSIFFLIKKYSEIFSNFPLNFFSSVRKYLKNMLRTRKTPFHGSFIPAQVLSPNIKKPTFCLLLLAFFDYSRLFFSSTTYSNDIDLFGSL